MPPSVSPITPDYAWNENAGRYYSLRSDGSRGRFVQFAEVKGALNTVIQASQSNVVSISQSLRDGTINLAEWQTRMIAEIKTMHVAAAAAARGGWAQMSQSDWGATGQLIRFQYEKLRGFAEDIASGKQRLDGRLLVRARLYAKAARGTFEQMRRRWERDDNGMTEERRVLGVAEHCPGCLEQASKKWQPIGTLDPIGAEECVTNCQCHFEYRMMTPAGWVYSG